MAPRLATLLGSLVLLAALHVPALAGRVEGLPPNEYSHDDFIVICRQLVADWRFHMVHEGGQLAIEGNGLTRDNPEHIIALFSSYFEDHGASFKVTPGNGQLTGTWLIHGKVNGLEKRVLITPGGSQFHTAMKITSFQNEPRLERRYQSIFESEAPFPNLPGKTGYAREFHVEGSYTGAITKETDGPPNLVYDQVRRQLLAAGWEEDHPLLPVKDAPPDAFPRRDTSGRFFKGDLDAHLLVVGNPKRSHIRITVRRFHE